MIRVTGFLIIHSQKCANCIVKNLVILEKIPTNQNHPYYMNTWWVNYQKQNEFNPLHDHSGVYSFIVWMKIPTNHDEQNRNPLASRSNIEKISVVDFLYSNILEPTSSIRISYESRHGRYYVIFFHHFLDIRYIHFIIVMRIEFLSLVILCSTQRKHYESTII